MTQVFLKMLNMSISASWVVLAVLVLRLLLKKAPKWLSVTLWGIVGIRLISPFSLESALSLIPSKETISPDIMLDQSPEIYTGIPVLNSTLNPVINNSFSPEPTASANPLQLLLPFLAIVWVVGILGMLLYTLFSYQRIKKKVETAVILRDNIFQSENVSSPFVLGIIKPRIYLPFNISNNDFEHVIAHENAHISRKDHLWKPLGFLLLSIHWFNPLMWLGYVLLCRDIELACDEKVIKKLGTEQKADYSQALLSCSINRKLISACPLAFGEVGVKNRVKSVLNYKKPAFWLIIVSVILCIVVAVCFLTDPAVTDSKALNYFIEEQLIEQHYGSYAEGEYCCVDFEILGKKKSGKNTTLYMWVLYEEFSRENGKIENISGAHLATAFTFTKENGEYKLVEHWIPRDGSYYIKDLRSKFPWYLWLTDGTRYIDSQQEKLRKKAEKYFSSISTGEKHNPTDKEITSNALESLKEKYPTYFNLQTSKGLEVYIWQMGDSIYSCGLLPGRNLHYSGNELWELHKYPATLEEMRLIVASYFPMITKEDVSVIPIQMPHSSFAYVIDDAYLKKVSDLFWTDFPWLSTTGYTASLASASFDIDGDGLEEKCTLSPGPTSGLFTVIFTVYSNYELEYFNIFNFSHTNLAFVENADGKTVLTGENFGEKTEFDIKTQDGNIVIYDGESMVPYWGTQGLNSPYAPKAVNKLNKAIASVLSEKYGKENSDKNANIQSFCIIASDTASGTPLVNENKHVTRLNVYMLVANARYEFNDYVNETQREIIPAVITFDVDENEGYVLIDYWTPSSQQECEKEVREKVPSPIADELLKFEKFEPALDIDCWKQAHDYFAQIS